MKIKTFAPHFSGFYETLWDIDTDNFTDEDDNVVDYERLEIDFEGYKNEIGRRYCQELVDFFPTNLIKSIEFESVYSPKFYNFSTDSINCTVDADLDLVRAFLDEEWERFTKHVKEKYTSCDGFISWHSNDADVWREETKNFTDFSEEAHKFGDILGFILDVAEEETEGDFEQEMLWKVEPSNVSYEYITVKPCLLEDASNEQIDAAFRAELPNIDLDFGYVKLQVADAKSRAELFGNDWLDELSREIKEELLSSIGITPEIIINNY